MLALNKIRVPNYQRTYSWETETSNGSSPKHTNEFIYDLENHVSSQSDSSYYFGHFLFEKKNNVNDEYSIIDGQQRLTTIIIFLSAIFKKIKESRTLNVGELEMYENTIKRNATYHFETVAYDDRFFKDYVVDQITKSKIGINTQSANRIAIAFDYFTEYLNSKDLNYVNNILHVICNATCTTHIVKKEAEAIQMFIFQNNRGKKPTNLEIIKAQFLYTIHLKGGDEKENLIEAIKDRFEEIYKSISKIEHNINEDDILLHSLKVYFNSLWENNPMERINNLLKEAEAIGFIKSFTHSLSSNFQFLTQFYTVDEKKYFEIHSLISMGRIGFILPFVLKAYHFEWEINEKLKLISSLESLILRHRLIGTRAILTSRINDVYQSITFDVSSISETVERIKWMKTVDSGWYSYWNNNELGNALDDKINHREAKFILWKYENHLLSQGKNGYNSLRFDMIESPELEHIAPNTENRLSGYDRYDNEFRNQYLDSLGNYLLISKSHNASVGNYDFNTKLESYNHLEQQREIQTLTKEDRKWTKELIQNRKEKIKSFVIENL